MSKFNVMNMLFGSDTTSNEAPTSDRAAQKRRSSMQIESLLSAVNTTQVTAPLRSIDIDNEEDSDADSEGSAVLSVASQESVHAFGMHDLNSVTPQGTPQTAAEVRFFPDVAVDSDEEEAPPAPLSSASRRSSSHTPMTPMSPNQAIYHHEHPKSYLRNITSQMMDSDDESHHLMDEPAGWGSSFLVNASDSDEDQDSEDSEQQPVPPPPPPPPSRPRTPTGLLVEPSPAPAPPQEPEPVAVPRPRTPLQMVFEEEETISVPPPPPSRPRTPTTPVTAHVPVPTACSPEELMPRPRTPLQMVFEEGALEGAVDTVSVMIPPPPPTPPPSRPRTPALLNVVPVPVSPPAAAPSAEASPPRPKTPLQMLFEVEDTIPLTSTRSSPSMPPPPPPPNRPRLPSAPAAMSSPKPPAPKPVPPPIGSPRMVSPPVAPQVQPEEPMQVEVPQEPMVLPPMAPQPMLPLHSKRPSRLAEAYLQNAGSASRDDAEPLLVSPMASAINPPSAKVNQVMKNMAEGLLKKTLADQQQGIDVLQAVRRASIIRSQQAEDEQQHEQRLSLDIDTVTVASGKQQPVSSLSSLSRPPSSRRLTSLTGQAGSSTYNISPFSPMDGPAQAAHRKRGAITAIAGQPATGSRDKDRDSPVISLWTKDASDQAMDDLFVLHDGASRDDDTLSAYSAAGGSTATPSALPRSRSSRKISGYASMASAHASMTMANTVSTPMDRKRSRMELLDKSGSLTPMSVLSGTGMGPSNKQFSEEDARLAEAALTFTSTIKRTMSQASILAFADMNKASPAADKGKDVKEEVVEDVSTKPPTVLFPDLEELAGDWEEDLTTTLMRSSSPAPTPLPAVNILISPKLHNQPRRSSISGNGSLLAVAGQEELLRMDALTPMPSPVPGTGLSKPLQLPIKQYFSTPAPVVAMAPRPAELGPMLSAYFETLGEALRPGVLRVFRLIELGLGNASNVLAPVPKRRASTLGSIPGAAARRMSTTSPSSVGSNADSSSSAAARPASRSSLLMAIHPATSLSASWLLDADPIVPVMEHYNCSNLLAIINQREQRNADLAGQVKVLLGQSLVYEKPDEVMRCAAVLWDICKQLEQQQELAGEEDIVMGLDLQEVYRLSKVLLQAFSAEDSTVVPALKQHLDALLTQRAAWESRQQLVQVHQSSEESKGNSEADALLPVPLAQLPMSMAARASLLRTEAASVCAQMMVFLIPCNLALIELLFKLSLLREALLAHLTHYKGLYKGQAAESNEGFGKDQYRFLRAYCRSAFDAQLKLELSLVDPIFNKFNAMAPSSSSSSSTEKPLAQRIQGALKELNNLRINETSNASGDTGGARSRSISGQSLVSKVQALLLRAEDLSVRMISYRDRQAKAQEQHAHRLDDDSDSDMDDEAGQRKTTSKEEDAAAADALSLAGPLADLLRQKEEIRRKVHSFSAAYLEEVDALVKHLLLVPFSTVQPVDHSYRNSDSPDLLHSPAGCLTVGDRIYPVHCGLDQLSNRLWEAPLKKDEVSICSLALRAANLPLLQSIFQCWPGLVLRIPVEDEIAGSNSPGQQLHQHSVSSSRSGASTITSAVAMAAVAASPGKPMSSKRAVPPPPPLPVVQPKSSTSWEMRRAASLDLSAVDFSSPRTLRPIGMSLWQLWDSACYSWPQLLSAGFPLQHFKHFRNAQNAAAQAHNSTAMSSSASASGQMGGGNSVSRAGTASEADRCAMAGSPWQCHLSVLELRKAGYSISQCRAAGFDAAALLAGGFSELDLVCCQLFTTRQLQRVGCDIQRLALKELFEATGGRHWRNREHWNSAESIANWFGVWVDGRGVVVRIDLRGNQLTGSLPAALCLLTGLEYLDLSGNALSGLLSAEAWASFSCLKEVWLDRNAFEAQDASSNKAMLARYLPKCIVRF